MFRSWSSPFARLGRRVTPDSPIPNGGHAPVMSTETPGLDCEMLSPVPERSPGGQTECQRTFLPALLCQHPSQQADQGLLLFGETGGSRCLASQTRVSYRCVGVVLLSLTVLFSQQCPGNFPDPDCAHGKSSARPPDLRTICPLRNRDRFALPGYFYG